MQIPLLSTACCVVTTDSYPSMLADITDEWMQMLLLSSACCAITTESCYSTVTDIRKPDTMSKT